MSYIVGTSLSREKTVVFSLCGIYGIGKNLSKLVCDKSGLSPDCYLKDLNNVQIKMVENAIEMLPNLWGKDLLRFQKDRIYRLYSISCYRGFRHRKGLPVRGQRTHTNSKRRPIYS